MIAFASIKFKTKIQCIYPYPFIDSGIFYSFRIVLNLLFGLNCMNDVFISISIKRTQLASIQASAHAVHFSQPPVTMCAYAWLYSIPTQHCVCEMLSNSVLTIGTRTCHSFSQFNSSICIHIMYTYNFLLSFKEAKILYL